LAEALSGNDQKSEALQHIDAALKRWPENTDALLGKANILSLQDKLVESSALYHKVLDKDPGKSFCTYTRPGFSVAGYHRKGISRYEEILRHYPKNRMR